MKAASNAGLELARVEIDPKTARITLIMKDGETVEAKENVWDKEAPFILKTRKRKCKSDADTSG